MNNTELKLKIAKMTKSHPTNEVYDYLIAQVLCNAKEGISVNLIERMTGIKIKDVVMMNKLLFYWNFLNEEQRIQKAVNILEYVNKNVK